MNILGRILLIVAAVGLGVAGIPGLLGQIDYFNALGWGNIFNGSDNIAQFVTLIDYGLYCLFAVFAVIGVITGKKSVFMGIAAVVLMIAPVITIIDGVREGLFDWNFVWRVVCGFVFPICYFFGFLFV